MQTVFEKLYLNAPQSVYDLLEGLRDFRENPVYHPESSAFEHIKIVTNRLADTLDADLIMAGFFHDLFKAETQVLNEKTGYPSSPLHEKAVAEFIRTEKEVQEFIAKNGADVEAVIFICEQHMRVKRLGEMRRSKRWKLMRHELFSDMCLFALADKMHNNWEDCLRKWITGEDKNYLCIGDVTYGWLMEDEVVMRDFMLEDKKHRLNGNVLISMGFPQGKAIGLAMKFAQFNFCPLEEIIMDLEKVLLSPADFTDDELLGDLAKELIGV